MYQTEIIDDPLVRLIEWHTAVLVDVHAAEPAAAITPSSEAVHSSCE